MISENDAAASWQLFLLNENMEFNLKTHAKHYVCCEHLKGNDVLSSNWLEFAVMTIGF